MPYKIQKLFDARAWELILSKPAGIVLSSFVKLT